MSGEFLSVSERDAVPCEIGNAGVSEGVEVRESTAGVYKTRFTR